MHRGIGWGALVVLIGSAMVWRFGGVAGPSVAAEPKGFALVELFTSEGCSSCPPADKLLAKIAADARKSAQPVFCLSFHVDYWDGLGWKDPFADAAFTKRQQAYAQTLNLRSIYTPQMVVNGTDEFVGSDAKLATKSIADALARPTVTPITLKASADEKVVVVEYQVADAPAGAMVCVAWTEAEATSNPDRGENGGAKLRHVHVVRDFRTAEWKSPAEGKMSLKRLNVKAGSVVAFVQEAKTGRILGASAVEIAAK